MSEQNKTLARRWFEDLFSRGDLDAADEILSAEFVDHLPREEERGIEELKLYVSIYRSAFPDIQDTVEEIVAEGDKVVARWRSHGTHQGEIMGVAPSGRYLTFTGMRLFRMAENKIAESWVNIDERGLQEQLGASRARVWQLGPPSYPHSSECVEGEFCELPLYGVLRCSHTSGSRKLPHPL